MSSYLSRPRSLEQAKLEADMSLNAPSNAIQGMLAEGTEGLAKGALLEKEYGLKDLTGKDHNMFVETGYDMLTDPTALVGPLRHAFTSAGRVLKNPVKSYADVSASLSNYIDGFYGSGAGKAAVIPWLPKQVKRVFDNFSPDGLKMMEKHGITKPVVDMTAKYLSAIKSSGSNASVVKRTKKMAFAQVQHAAYMMHRAGLGKNDMPPLFQRMIESMSYKGTGFQPLSKSTYVDAVKDITLPYKGMKKVAKNDSQVVSKLFDRLTDAWKVGDAKTATGKDVDMIIRRPDPISGDFVTDVAQGSMTTALKGVFKNGAFGSEKELEQALIKHLSSSKGTKVGVGNVRNTLSPEEVARGAIKKTVQDPITGKDVKVNPYEVTGITVGDGGVYFRYKGTPVTKKSFGKTREGFELASKSYLEGGVNMQVHVSKEGKVTGIVSDNYDFFEDKIKATENILPKGILGVSVPIQLDILKRGTGKQVVNSYEPASTFGMNELEQIGGLITGRTPGQLTGATGMLTSAELVEDQRGQ